MSQINFGIEEVQAARRLLLDAFDQNHGFEEGLNINATDQYAQKSHFIYELLQNAGDAQATQVEFKLSQDALEFRHNGTKLFSLRDVDSITNYHKSTKGEDFDAVGKFGMGFKAVYSYTNEPEIHSGDYHFRIKRMFYPETEGVRADDVLEGWTKFIFPFGHPTRSRQEIFEEVRKGLLDIRRETLLFLNSILRIECLLDDGNHLRIERTEANHFVHIQSTTGEGRVQHSYFLKFTKEIPSPNPARQFEIALAYALKKKDEFSIQEDLLRLSQFALKLIEGRVFIYFPAEKEFSNLKFHIHAPFASPVSRESLTDCRDNDDLIREVAKLATESLAFLRDNGFLTVDQLEVFPLEGDDLARRYDVFRQQIVEAFNTRDLTPTKSGLPKPARQLIRSRDYMSVLFSDRDLATLFPSKESPAWVRAGKIHTRGDYFLEDLDIGDFGFEKLKEFATFYRGGSSPLVNVLRSFDDTRMLEFYGYLSECVRRENPPYGFGSVFRTTDKTLARPEELFFSVPGLDGDAGVKFLKEISGDKWNDLIPFFKKCGVREDSIENRLLSRQKKYVSRTLSREDIAENISIVRTLIKCFQRDETIVERIQGFRWLCTWETILTQKMAQRMMQKKYRERQRHLGRSVNTLFSPCINHVVLRSAADIILDLPYEETGMSQLVSVLGKCYLISPEYSRWKLRPDEWSALRQILSRFPFIRKIKLNFIYEKECPKADTRRYRKELRLSVKTYQHDPWFRDCEIEGFKRIVARKDERWSRQIWELIATLKDEGVEGNAFHAIAHHNSKYELKADSGLVCDLRDYPWVKTRDGQWKRPADVGFSTLDSMYHPHEMNPMLRAIGFGRNVVEDEKAECARKEYLKNLGVESEAQLRSLLARGRDAEGISSDEWQKMMAQRWQKSEMPSDGSNNPERREKKVAEEYETAAEQEYETRNRSVRVNKANMEASVRLQQYYKDESGDMRCQMCQREMPFRKKDGLFYFECVQIFRGMKKETADQYLALCPECAAVYDEWIRLHPENAKSLRRQICAMTYNGEGAIQVTLPATGTHECPDAPTSGRFLYFTGKHFLDLQTVLRKEGEAE